MKNDRVLKKLNFDLLSPSQGLVNVWGQNICLFVAVFVSLFKLICYMTNILKKLNFDLMTPSPGSGGGGGCGRLGAKYLLPCCCIHVSL